MLTPITLKSDILFVKINSFGAELRSIKLNNKKEFMWQAGSEWQRTAPVLFPIVGKLKNNQFSFNNTNYNIPQHGFARDNVFEVIAQTNFEATFVLKSNAVLKTNYPFDFEFYISYVLNNNSLTISYTIKNIGHNELPFSVGAHPAFNCDLNTSYLEFEKNDYLLSVLNDGLITPVKKELVLTDNKLQLSTTIFDNDALVFENNQINKISLCSKTSTQKITLNCTNWPYFGIWTKKGCDKFLCLEPWYGIADSVYANGIIFDKLGIIRLAAGKQFNASYTIEFVE